MVLFKILLVMLALYLNLYACVNSLLKFTEHLQLN